MGDGLHDRTAIYIKPARSTLACSRREGTGGGGFAGAAAATGRRGRCGCTSNRRAGEEGDAGGKSAWGTGGVGGERGRWGGHGGYTKLSSTFIAPSIFILWQYYRRMLGVLNYRRMLADIPWATDQVIKKLPCSSNRFSKGYDSLKD